MATGLDGRLQAQFVLFSPLSHIGESTGPNSFLATQTILGPDGQPEEVFVYSGNALRGVWRDAGAQYMLDKLGAGARLQIPLSLFHLLFSGGSIGGEQVVDIDQARQIRSLIPHLSVFGGGVGNMLLPGKISVGEALPVCRELAHIIPEHVPGARDISWRHMTTELSYTRKDDSKDELLRPYIAPENGSSALAPGRQQTALGSGSEDEGRAADSPATKAEKKDRPQQMRYYVEVLCRGAVLWQETTFLGLTEVELGALVAAIHEWGKNPVLGGQSRIGLGRVRAVFDWECAGRTEDREQFMVVGDGLCSLSEPAAQAKKRYDEFLKQYAGYLDNKRSTLIKAIGGKMV